MPLVLNGATSGSTTVQATDAVTATLTLPSSTGTLLSTANPQSGGVIQVQNTTIYKTSSVSTNSSSFTTTGISVTITPKFSTSKIFLVFNSHIYFPSSGNGLLTIYRNGSNVATGASPSCLVGYYGSADVLTPCSMSFYDSPATTSALTYTVYFSTTSNTLYLAGTTSNGNSSTVVFTAMEIAA